MSRMTNDRIDGYREDLRVIDDEILKQLQKRMDVSKLIALEKKEHGIPLQDPLAERERIDEITEGSPDDMKIYNRLLFYAISELSHDYQRQYVQEESDLVRSIRKAMETTPDVFPKSAVVACQGVQGSYSQQAVDKFFKMPNIMYMKNFEGVFAAVDQGLCRYGVLPLENSTAGSVNQIYDLLTKYRFYIVRSSKVKVDHCLLTKPGTKKEDIHEIFSHEQAVMQCENYLKNFPDARITVYGNTAAAARMVSESDRTDIAALSSYECGALYGLECLEERVQDSRDNYTRFICVSKEPEIYPGANRTSIMFTTAHKPGSLYNVLARFYSLGINISKLESRPIPSRDFDFRFYADIDVEIYADEFIRLMNQVNELSQDFCYMGSYSEIE